MKNGEKWTDTSGNELHAHGGCIMKFGAYYYWYGEDRRGSNYVTCYRSEDLRNWAFRNHILTTQSQISRLPQASSASLKRPFTGKKVNTERPKVLYCEKTRKYVMWAHYENGRHYREAAACVASCDTPDGDFVFHGVFRPFGNMSRDCTLFQEHDRAWFISAANENRDLKVYLLTDDYLNVKEESATLWPGASREAPVVFCRNGLYYMLSSACTGWAPNQGKFATSRALTSGWSALQDFGDETTFRSQPTWVVEKDGEFLYVGDRWGGDGKKYFDSTYVILKIAFQDDKPIIRYADDY